MNRKHIALASAIAIVGSCAVAYAFRPNADFIESRFDKLDHMPDSSGSKVRYKRDGSFVFVCLRVPGHYEVQIFQIDNGIMPVIPTTIVDVTDKEILWEHDKTVGWTLSHNSIRVVIKKLDGNIGEESQDFHRE